MSNAIISKPGIIGSVSPEMTTDMQREAFERWFEEKYGMNFTIGEYRRAQESWAACNESAQAELTELRAIVARLREPVSDDAVETLVAKIDDFVDHHGGGNADCLDHSQWEQFAAIALTAHNKRILGETE